MMMTLDVSHTSFHHRRDLDLDLDLRPDLDRSVDGLRSKRLRSASEVTSSSSSRDSVQAFGTTPRGLFSKLKVDKYVFTI